MQRIQTDGSVVDLGGGYEQIVWVPSREIVFHRVQLPTQSRKVWQQTAPFALEDEVVGSITRLHFALSTQSDADGYVTIATIEESLMSLWLESPEIGGMARVFCPDILAVPYEGMPTLWHEAGECYLRFGVLDGMACSLEWLLVIREIIDKKGELRVFSDDPDALPEDWRVIAMSLPSPLEDLMRQDAGNIGANINLLQGDYAPVSARDLWLGAWHRAGIVAMILLVLYPAHLMLESQHLRAHTELLNQATDKLLSEANFPKQGSSATMRAAVQRYMEKARSIVQEQSTGMWSLMLSMEPLLSVCKSCVVENVDFNRGQVVLTVSAVSLQKFEEGLQGLSQARYQRTDLPAEDERERARFSLRPSGS